MDDPVPHHIGPYKVIEEVGRGGMGVVYRARDPDDPKKSDVAIKVLLSEYENIAGFQRRLGQEARALVELSTCPHILSIRNYYDSGVADLGGGLRDYLVTDYLPGRSLQQRLQNEINLPIREALRITLQLLNALDCAHGRGLLHRDIKPGNILFEAEGTDGTPGILVLADFGLVKFLTENPGSDHNITPPGRIVGTERYMAPEVLRGETATYQSDLYSVGVVLYQMLIGPASFEGRNFKQLPDAISALNKNVPPQLDDVVFRALHEKPEQRYASADKMRAALQIIEQQLAPTVEATGQQFAPTVEVSAESGLPENANSPSRQPGNHHLPLTPINSPPEFRSKRKKLPWVFAIITFVLITVIVVLLFSGPLKGLFPAPVSTPTSAALPLPSSVIKIGVDLPLTGGNASSGLPIAGGVQSAIDQANQQKFLPGYTFAEYKSPGLDDRSDSATGAKNVNQMVNDALTGAIIGPYNSAVAESEIPLTNMAPIAQISPANTSPCLTKDTPAANCAGANDLLPQLRPTGMVTYFRLPTTDELFVKALVPFLRAQPRRYQTAYIVYNRADLYSKNVATLFAQEWQNANGTLVAPLDDEAPDSATQQYASQFKLLPSSPDFIFYAGTMPAAARVKQAMNSLPQLNQTAFVGGAGIMLNQFATAIGPGGGPVFAEVPIEDTAATQQFRTNYLSGPYSQNGYTPYTASASDCALIVMQAIKIVIQQDHVLPPINSSDIKEAKKFRSKIIQEILTITANKIPGIGTGANALTLATGFQGFNQNSGDNTNDYVSMYTLNGSSLWPWLLLKSDLAENFSKS